MNKITITIEEEGDSYEFHVKRENDNPMMRFEFGGVGPKKEAMKELGHYLSIYLTGE